MSEKDLIYTYQGIVNDDVVNDILRLAETALQSETIKPGVKRKIFRVLLEGIQNSYKHQGKLVMNDITMQEITILLVRKDEYFKLILGNYIDNSEALGLKENIDQINVQSELELKEKYRETLNNNARTKAGGSGLGLMDIARKTGELLDYKFSKVNDNISYFTLNLKINRNE